MIYLRQEKYDLAEYHFRRAVCMNQLSSVLYCYLGMVQHANKKTHEGLQMLKTAIQLDPHNHLAKFQHVSVLVSLGQYQVSAEVAGF